MDNRKLAAALREYNVWKKGEVNAMPFKSGQLSMLLDQAAAALEASAEAESVIEELVKALSNTKDAVIAMKDNFEDRDANSVQDCILCCCAVANESARAITRAREYQGKKEG